MAAGQDTTAYRLCECGCGQPTRIASRTDRRFGWFRGKPMRFLRGHAGHHVRPLAERFWEKVDQSRADGCWLWMGSTNSFGYGRIYDGGRPSAATRIAWELHHGCPVPDGLDLCHSCDNPPCVNPEHLFLGTAKYNARDMMRKGRQASKLTAADVPVIRRRLQTGETQAAIAREYGVSQVAISKIKRGFAWGHV